MTNETQRANEGCYLGAADYDQDCFRLEKANRDFVHRSRVSSGLARPRLIRSHWQFAALVFVPAFVTFVTLGAAMT